MPFLILQSNGGGSNELRTKSVLAPTTPGSAFCFCEWVRSLGLSAIIFDEETSVMFGFYVAGWQIGHFLGPILDLPQEGLSNKNFREDSKTRYSKINTPISPQVSLIFPNEKTLSKMQISTHEKIEGWSQISKNHPVGHLHSFGGVSLSLIVFCFSQGENTHCVVFAGFFCVIISVFFGFFLKLLQCFL